MNNNQALNEIKKIIDVRTLLLGAILSVIFFGLFSMSFKTYQSTVTILVASKSDATAINQDQIINSIAQFPKTLNFYEKLLADNPEVKENNIGNSPSVRKELWNKMIEVKRSPKNSSLIKIKIIANSEKDAEKLSVKSARTLFDTASSYYNVKTDIDMRLVDGPIVERSMENWPWLAAISVVLGISFAFIFQKFIPSLKNAFQLAAVQLKENIAAKEQQAEKTISEEKETYNESEETKTTPTESTGGASKKELSPDDKSEQDKELEALNKIIQQDIYPNFPEMPVSEQKKSSAPDNLPVADSSFLMDKNSLENQEKIHEEIVDQPKEEQPHREPTPEELKKRLNELLRGKI